MKSSEPLRWLSSVREPPSCAWFFTLTNEGGPYLAVAREADGYRVRVHGVADYLVQPTSLAVEPFVDAAAESVEVAFELDVKPILHQLDGHPALHASAVANEAGAVAFSGPSGVGKSTLAALLSKRAGYRLLADDSVPLDRQGNQFIAMPTASAVRLRRGSAQQLGETAHMQFEKYVARRKAAESGCPLRAIYSLWLADAVRIDPMSPREAMAFVASHLQRIDPDNAELLRREFEHVDAVVRHVVVAHLSYPRDFESTAVAEAIEEHARASLR